jgi:hypothetical protein
MRSGLSGWLQASNPLRHPSCTWIELRVLSGGGATSAAPCASENSLPLLSGLLTLSLRFLGCLAHTFLLLGGRDFDEVAAVSYVGV